MWMLSWLCRLMCESGMPARGTPVLCVNFSTVNHYWPAQTTEQKSNWSIKKILDSWEILKKFELCHFVSGFNVPLCFNSEFLKARLSDNRRWVPLRIEKYYSISYLLYTSISRINRVYLRLKVSDNLWSQFALLIANCISSHKVYSLNLTNWKC